MNNVIIAAPMFHATPYWNFDPILWRGIDPALSRGQLPVSWYVSEAKVEWAITHVAEKYRCLVKEVIVFEVIEKPIALFWVSSYAQVFRTSVLMRPSAVYPAYNWFPIEN